MEIKRITVSELIKKLEKIKEEHGGDIPVTVHADGGIYEFECIRKVDVIVWDGIFYKEPIKTVYLSTDN